MLTPSQTDLWNAYQRLEDSGPRQAMLRALDAFLNELTQDPLETWSDWALELAESVVDGREQVRIRMPLYRRVLFPALLAGCSSNVPGCARWLAGFPQQLYGSEDLRRQLPEDCQTEEGLLHAALQLDPKDEVSRRRLVAAWAYQLAFRIHEVPSGVLYDMNGATAEHCLELQEWLAAFCELAEQAQLTESYERLIHDCEFHFREYRSYLMDRAGCKTYAEFLNRSARTGVRPLGDCTEPPADQL